MNKDQFYKIHKETIDNLFDSTNKGIEFYRDRPMCEESIELRATCETLKFIIENSILENE